MNTQQSNAKQHTDGFKLGRLPRLLSSILPTFRFSRLQFSIFILRSAMVLAFAPRAEAATGGGGNSTNDIGADWRYHTFTNNGEFTVSGEGNLYVQYLVVAGGGGACKGRGGGGGAGGFLYGAATMTNSASPYTIRVGTGGAAGTTGMGSDGGNTSISNATPAQVVLVNGGGRGGSRDVTSGTPNSGGSGGGGRANSTAEGGRSGAAGNTPPTTPSQGNAGGAGNFDSAPTPDLIFGGGGGGAGGVGGSVGAALDTPTWYDNRGAPATNSITGSLVAYAQGGGGGDESNQGIGGGASGTSSNGVNGTGGGGGGGKGSTALGGRGGDGIVIIRYFIGSDSTPPTLVSMDDGNSGNTVCPNTFQMTYAVTFSEDIVSNLTTSAFDNAGTAGITIDSVARTFNSLSNFVVKVTPTSVGTLRLRVKASAVQDFAGNSMLADGTDDTTVTVADNEPCSYGLGVTKQIVGGTNIFTFTTNGILAIRGGSRDVKYLVVAGGGGSCGGRGGGGGAGGLLYGTTNLPATNYTITVGTGGRAGRNLLIALQDMGLNGGNTSISNATAQVVLVNGGGYGGSRSGTAPNSGGSGGGGGSFDAGVASSGAAGNTPLTTPSQGNAGGAGRYTASPAVMMGGGGGGAGGVGGSWASPWTDNRGAPTNISITGSSVAYAQGGGGADENTSGLGGGVVSGTSTNGVNGTGGGGGGGKNVTTLGGRGGDGVVILAFPPLPVPPKGTVFLMR